MMRVWMIEYLTNSDEIARHYVTSNDKGEAVETFLELEKAELTYDFLHRIIKVTEII